MRAGECATNKLTGVSFLLAAIAAVIYFLTGLGVLTVPGIEADAPALMPYICAGCYLLGGLLIFTGKRWLLITGALINLLVMGIFLAMYNQNSAVLTSLPGLSTKITQMFLEIGLIALIVRRKDQGIMAAHNR